MNKNTILLVIMVIITIVPSYAQRLNSRNQKVVSKIEKYYPMRNDDGTKTLSLLTIILFDYDADFNLIGIDYNSPKSERNVWKRNGNNITRSSYYFSYEDKKEKPDRNCRFSYELDTNGLITKDIRDQIGIDGSIRRYIYSFSYDEDTYLNLIYERIFYAFPNKPFDEGSVRHKIYMDKDSFGNVFRASLDTYEYQTSEEHYNEIEWWKREYSDYKSDTNIDLSELCLYRYSSISNSYWEILTEWTGNHSKNLIKCTKSKRGDISHRYEYTFDDNNNVIQIDVYDDGYYNKNKFETSYKIYYLK